MGRFGYVATVMHSKFVVFECDHVSSQWIIQTVLRFCIRSRHFSDFTGDAQDPITFHHTSIMLSVDKLTSLYYLWKWWRKPERNWESKESKINQQTVGQQKKLCSLSPLASAEVCGFLHLGWIQYINFFVLKIILC